MLCAIWRKEQIPDSWGRGIIHPIYKGKGSLKEAKNYRGITLLNCTLKIYTGVLCNRLTEWVEKRKLLVKEQAGFRKGFGTVDNAFVLNFLVEKEIQRKGKLYTCFIDFKRAFDSVNREFLWKKMSRLGLPEKFVRILMSVYAKVEMKVCVNGDECTRGFEAERGVRQGCKLSPLLFALFINDLPEYLENVEMHAPCIGVNEVKMLMYADDVVLVSQSAVGLQRGLNKVNEYSSKYELQVNVEKTKVMIFKSGRKRDRKFYYGGKDNIEVVSSFKYLGLLFQENGAWTKH